MVMRTAEWINLVLFSFFVIASWFRPLTGRARIATSAIGVIGIGLIIAAQFAHQVLPPFAVSVARDWLPAPLMPMVYWQAGRCSVRLNESFQKKLHRVEGKWLGALLQSLAVKRSYGWISSGLELAYLSCYVLVPLGLGVLYLAHVQRYANEYWAVVLPATYPCYVFTAFVPTLPPRMLETDSVRPLAGRLRVLNLWIVRHASIRVNTFPSAHVTATLAGSLVLLSYVPGVGLAFLLVSIGIAIGAITGRYHYIADVVVAAALAVAVYTLEVLFT